MEHSPPIGQRPRILLEGKSAGFRLSPFEAIVLIVTLLITAFAGYTVYARSTDLNSVPATPNTYLPAFRTTLTSSVSATGTVQSTQQVTLTFGSAGKIKEFLVKLGERVTAGQSLARIDDTDLQQTLRSAEASLASSQATYAARTDGPTATEIATANQAIASASAQVSTAQKNLDDLKAGPKAADIATAQQGVNTAQTALRTAQDAVPKAQNDVVAAQNAVSTAQNSVTSAEAGVSTARNGVTTAQNALTQARAAVTTARNNVSTAQDEVRTAEISRDSAFVALQVNASNFNSALGNCRDGGNGPVPAGYVLVGLNSVFVSSGQTFQAIRPLYSNESCHGGSAQLDPLKTQITSFNSSASSYNSAQGVVTTRQNSVTTARNAVTTAENAVTKADNDVDTAQRSVATAQTNVTEAQVKVTTAQTALTTAQIATTNGNLQRAIDNANIGVTSAQTKLQEALAGPKPVDIEAAERTLDSAYASLTSANARFDELFVSPPPDVMLPLQANVAQAQANVETAKKNLAAATIVAPFDGQISQMTGEAGTSVTATTAVFILLNPALLRIDANVDQADVNNLQPGQSVTATFDALQGRSYQGTVTAIGLTPTTQQGVVTYVVNLAIDTSRLASGTPAPTPGMTASLSVTTSRAANALVVPQRAIRRQGRTSTVTVKTPEGDVARTVTTGVTNGTLTQIAAGLNEGDEVLVSAARPATSTTPTTGGGGVGGGGAPGGGGFQQAPVVR